MNDHLTLSPETKCPSDISTSDEFYARSCILDKFVPVKQLYKADIGNTTVSMVRKANDVFSKDQRYILKEIDLRMLSHSVHISQCRSEFAIQSEINHEHVVKCFEYEDQNNYIRAILELVNEPEYLQVQLDDNLEPIADEATLKRFMRELLGALTYIHKKNIVHCDIKIENILAHIPKGRTYPSLKLCDFGLSKRVDPTTQQVYIEKRMGTRSYMAPEIKDSSRISTKVDIWALGLVFYKMCTTYLPDQICRDWWVKDQTVPFREDEWTNRSPELKDLISKMLRVEPTTRISAQEAMNHPYLQV